VHGSSASRSNHNRGPAKNFCSIGPFFTEGLSHERRCRCAESKTCGEREFENANDDGHCCAIDRFGFPTGTQSGYDADRLYFVELAGDAGKQRKTRHDRNRGDTARDGQLQDRPGERLVEFVKDKRSVHRAELSLHRVPDHDGQTHIGRDKPRDTRACDAHFGDAQRLVAKDQHKTKGDVDRVHHDRGDEMNVRLADAVEKRFERKRRDHRRDAE
jgi:hypothetical protein